MRVLRQRKEKWVWTQTTTLSLYIKHSDNSMDMGCWGYLSDQNKEHRKKHALLPEYMILSSYDNQKKEKALLNIELPGKGNIR